MHTNATPFKPRLSLLVASIALAMNAGTAHAAYAGIDVYAPTLGSSDTTYDPHIGGSGDGSTLVGAQYNPSTDTTEAFKWTLLGGKQLLASLGTNAAAYAASNEADVIVGSSVDNVTDSETAVYWNSTGIHKLGFLNGGAEAEARAVSADGSVIAGSAEDGLTGNRSAVTWNLAGAVTQLGYLNDGTYSYALGMSADGSVVVGYSQNGAGNGDVATRWVEGGSAESLGTLDGGTQSIATATSADGTYIVGASDSSLALSEAMIWSELSGMQGLGLLADGTLSKAEGVSANGAVVVGVADTTGSVLSGFRWTAETGMQSLVEWLQHNDPSYTLLANNTLNTATSVSADGNTVFGLGFLNSRWQPFVARSYGPISEPVVPTPPVVTTPPEETTPEVTPPVVTPPVTDPTPPSTGGSSNAGDTSTGGSDGAGTGAGGTEAGAGTGGTGGTETGTGGTVGNDTGAGGADVTTPPTGVIGLLDLGDSLQNATLYAQAMQNQLQGFVQDQLTCSTFDTSGICVSVSSQMTHHSGTVQGDNVYGGVTAAYRLTPDLVAGIGYQGPSTSLKINDDRVEGDTNTIGAFVEYGNRLRNGVFARGAVAVSEGDATIKRSYKTGAGDVESKGKADVSQRAVSGQVGYVFILQDNIAVMPFLGLDYLNTKLGSYTETSGSFPAHFDKRTEENIYGTAGLNASMNLANKAIVSANIKHVSRLNNSQDDLTGDVMGVSRFDMKQDTTERWNEVGVGLQVAGPFKASRVGITYGHRFGSDKAVASDVATLSLSVGF